MKYQAQLKVSNLHPEWFRLLPKAQIEAEETYQVLNDSGCSAWAGLAALHSLAMSELKYFARLEPSKEASSLDPQPAIPGNSLKSKLLKLSIEKVDLLSYNEIRILNMLIDNDRKYVAEKLGIKKARLSQIIKNIRTKLNVSEQSL